MPHVISRMGITLLLVLVVCARLDIISIAYSSTAPASSFYSSTVQSMVDGNTLKPTAIVLNSTCYDLLNLASSDSGIVNFTNASFFIRDNYVSSTGAGVTVNNLTSYSLIVRSLPVTIGISSLYLSTIQLANISYTSGAYTASVYVCVKPIFAPLIGISTIRNATSSTLSARGSASYPAPSLTIQNLTTTAGEADLVAVTTPISDDGVSIYVGGVMEVTGRGFAIFNASVLSVGNYTVQACDAATGACSARYLLSVEAAPVPLSPQVRKTDPVRWITALGMVLLGMLLLVIIGRHIIHSHFNPPEVVDSVKKVRPPLDKGDERDKPEKAGLMQRARPPIERGDDAGKYDTAVSIKRARPPSEREDNQNSEGTA